MTALILPVDCREGMRLCLAPQSVHCCVTSPPYFGLRDYDHAEQLGRETTPAEYVAGMVDVFRQVRRVLRDDGTLWLNIGDSYTGSGKGGNPDPGSSKQATNAGSQADGCLYGTGKTAREAAVTNVTRKNFDLGPKQLIGIPWRLAFALQADGWVLRQDIIWSKPNPMPESVRDRCAKAHEYIFLFSKSPKYYFDAEAIKEPAVQAGRQRTDKMGGNKGDIVNHSLGSIFTGSNFRNRRSVWTVPTKGFKGAHFATFPPDLIESCILAGSPPSCCAMCGAPRLAIIERTGMVINRSNRTHSLGCSRSSGTMVSPASSRILRYEPSCKCGASDAASVVLDPFGGSGTTALVAQRYGRDSILFEINEEYVAMAHARLAAAK